MTIDKEHAQTININTIAKYFGTESMEYKPLKTCKEMCSSAMQ